MTDFFVVFMPTERGQTGVKFEITGETPEEVMLAAEACAPDAPEGYYLFAIRTRRGDTEGGFVWVTGTDWNLEAFYTHVNPPASEE